MSAGMPEFVTGTFLRDHPLCNGLWRAGMQGVRGLGKSLDGDVRGRRFLLGGVILIPLLLPSWELQVKTFPCWACDVRTLASFLSSKASRGFLAPFHCLVHATWLWWVFLLVVLGIGCLMTEHHCHVHKGCTNLDALLNSE